MELLLPCIPSLDSLSSAADIISTLETQGVRQPIACCNWAEAFPYRPLSTFTAAYTPEALYVDFFVRCNYLRAENYQDQSTVSADSCVEVFLQPRPDGEYWNFEFNCIGAINASHRRVRPEPTRLSSEELAQVLRHPSCGTRPFKEVEGLFTWNLLVRIPFSLMGIPRGEAGMVIHGNFYKCASAASQPHYLSWSPIHTPKPDFHRPEFFGKIILT